MYSKQFYRIRCQIISTVVSSRIGFEKTRNLSRHIEYIDRTKNCTNTSKNFAKICRNFIFLILLST